MRAGTHLEMQLFHDGTDSLIKDIRNSGTVKIQADNFTVIDKDAGQTMLTAAVDGAVGLYHSGSKKLETTDTGVVITGIATATDFDSTSDIRLKTNIQPIDDPLAKVIQIEGVSFNWKENNRPALGVIADQVEEIIPELVHGDDPKTVNYNGLIGLLIEAVKEQQTQIDSLKNRLSKLE